MSTNNQSTYSETERQKKAFIEKLVEIVRKKGDKSRGSKPG